MGEITDADGGVEGLSEIFLWGAETQIIGVELSGFQGLSVEGCGSHGNEVQLLTDGYGRAGSLQL
jgi:hypothetical protein